MKDKEKGALIFGSIKHHIFLNKKSFISNMKRHKSWKHFQLICRTHYLRHPTNCSTIARTILTHMDFVQNCRAQCFCFIHRYDESICESNDYSNYLLLSYDQNEWPWTKNHAIHSILRWNSICVICWKCNTLNLLKVSISKIAILKMKMGSL